MIIDSHVHLPSVGWKEDESYFKTVEDAIEYLKACGISAAIFNLWQGVLAKDIGDIEKANSDALRIMGTFEGFLLAGAVIHPAYLQESLDWLKRFRNRGILWVGELVPYNHGIPYRDDRFLKIFEYCEKEGHLVQLHYDEDIFRIIDKFPDLRIVVSHIPEDPILEKLAVCDKVSLDISGSAGGLVIGKLESAVKIMGAQKLLFGSDYTGYEPTAFINRVKKVVVNEQDRERIFCGNLMDILTGLEMTSFFNIRNGS
jgi:predicted TIM-barrel fold metal-dependent hydrolase